MPIPECTRNDEVNRLPLSTRFAWLVFASVACESPAPAPQEATVVQAEAKRPTTADRQKELLDRADAELSAGKVEPAIVAFLDAEKLGPLGPPAAERFAVALKRNGDTVVAGGDEIPRAINNYAKALTLAPKTEGLSEALLAAAAKLDAQAGMYAEDVIGIYLEENKPELNEEIRTALAGVFLANADRLLSGRWNGLRAYRNLERATELSPKLPGLEEAWDQARTKLDEELVASVEVEKALHAAASKQPDVDPVEVVAKRRKMTRDEITRALELVAFTREFNDEQLAKECGPKPSCGGLRGGCQGDRTAFGTDVEVSRCTPPKLVEGKCWVVECDVEDKKTGASARYELSYKAIEGVPMPVGAQRVR